MTHNVTGIGGIFFRCEDPDALTAWYAETFGITANDAWPQAEGVSVLGLFKKDSDYWPKDRAFMFNIRVDDLDAVTERLREAGNVVKTNPDWDVPEIGRFARTHDPEGNPIELWQPAAP